MSKSKKISTREATRAEAAGMETAALTGASVPCPYSTSNAAPGQLSIADFLGHSRETARTSRELCAALDVDSRTLRQRIEAERRAGALIVADNASGYWVTTDPAEAQAFARSMRHRAHEIIQTARAIERGAGLD